MDMSELLNEVLKNKRFQLDKKKLISCDWKLLLNEPAINTKFCAISDDDSGIELGLSYIKDKSQINFHTEYLPRGELFNRKVAFLDRDGVLIEDTDYPGKIDDVIFKEDTVPLLRQLIDLGYDLIVVTNQSGIARGKYTTDDFLQTTKYISDYFKSIEIPIIDTFHCPYHIDGTVLEFKRESLLRKPMPGMIIKASEAYNVDLSRSLMIGDKISDILNCSYLKYFIKNINNHPNCYKSFKEISIAISKL